jgi:hypothetical protein
MRTLTRVVVSIGGGIAFTIIFYIVLLMVNPDPYGSGVFQCPNPLGPPPLLVRYMYMLAWRSIVVGPLLGFFLTWKYAFRLRGKSDAANPQ